MMTTMEATRATMDGQAAPEIRVKATPQASSSSNTDRLGSVGQARAGTQEARL